MAPKFSRRFFDRGAAIPPTGGKLASLLERIPENEINDFKTSPFVSIKAVAKIT
jgi:hypothetical protein